MKRLPLYASFVVFIVLCVSLSYWGLRMFRPQVRPLAVPPGAAIFEPAPGQWGGLFGASQIAQAASNYQLKGVVVAARPQESVAIIGVNGQATLAVAVNREFAPGVKVTEVHDGYVILSEGGVNKRVDLPQAKSVPSLIAPGPATSVPVQPVIPQQPAGLGRNSPPPAMPVIPAASLPAAMPGAPLQ
ncbi:type II secretion system protein N [Undibacterium sp.]|uniref:type II secretion system protein N n=1 Tax=Undibacterium sp. TaxID=1914977 RepID=UPI002B8EBBF4|nr:type II secretion system protein N [Undibacterium sp.]HTD02357.1 type II secretion system protein N [Undibacterium sp.]